MGLFEGIPGAAVQWAMDFNQFPVAWKIIAKKLSSMSALPESESVDRLNPPLIAGIGCCYGSA
jgi:hypothetical protein